MSTNLGLTPVFGGASIGDATKAFADDELIGKLYNVLLENGCHTIDTARLYANSEEIMGTTFAGKKFTIDTKTPGGFIPGQCTGETILNHARESIKKLGIPQMDIFYIHSPDASLDLKDQLSGIQEAYEEGLFKRFGLSNFVVEDVERVYSICKSKGWVLPTVYQGNYSAIARKQETLLFPTLRKLGISFYVYSPIAGGYLTKTRSQITGASSGRFSHDHAFSKMYHGLYNKESYLNALDIWEAAANEAGISKAELAYRWVAFNSPLNIKYGDAIIFGASKLDQVSETLRWLKAGPLPQKTVQKIDELWKTIEKDAPLDNYNSFAKK